MSHGAGAPRRGDVTQTNAAGDLRLGASMTGIDLEGAL